MLEEVNGVAAVFTGFGTSFGGLDALLITQQRRWSASSEC